MRIDDFKLFFMVDDSDDELFLTKAIFQLTYPGLPFRCEKDPTQVIPHLRRAAATGIRPSEICVLIDIRMPRTNGFELVYTLRNEIDTFECCILMLSASRVLDDRDHSTAIGADGFVTKPFKIGNLEHALAGFQGTARAA